MKPTDEQAFETVIEAHLLANGYDSIAGGSFDRDPREPVFEFKRRTLTHFAADTESVLMTTRLEGEARPLDGPTEVGTGLARPQPVPLSQLIDIVNDRFGTDFNQADQLFFDQVVEAAMANDGVRQAAAVNPGDKFELVFKGLLKNLFAERMDQNEDIFVRFMNDESFQNVVTSWMSSEAYRRSRSRRWCRHRARGDRRTAADVAARRPSGRATL